MGLPPPIIREKRGQLTLFHNAQLRALGLYDLLQLLQVRVQALDLIIIERNRLRRSLDKKSQIVSLITQPPDISPSRHTFST